MNQRIQQLALEAEVFAKQNNSDFHYFYTRKFAELIVRECANICFSQAEGHRMAFGEHCGIVIKEHFGVEE